jgi:hypothetical protein
MFEPSQIMTIAIPDLWSDDIKVDVVTPLAILRAQTGPISRKTKGILEAEVTTISSEAGRVRHQLDLIASVLDGYRHRLLAATHERDLVYPVTVEAECFKPAPTSGDIGEALESVTVPEPDWRPRAYTEQEFIDLVSKALRSGEVRSIIQSLIARSNERMDNARIPPQTGESEERDTEESPPSN